MTRKGSDAEQVAKLLKEHDRRLTRIEKNRQSIEELTDTETENGFLVETNITAKVYEKNDDPDEDEPVQVSETHNEATNYADKYLATCMKHQGAYPPRPEEMKFGIGDRQWVGTTPISESYVSGTDTVMTAYLDSTELSGHTLKEMGVQGADGLFNYAPLDPIDKSGGKQVKIKVRFVFLHA